VTVGLARVRALTATCSTYTYDPCPSAVPTGTSLGTPWIVDVTGATITVDRTRIACRG
jgi:hypothetical protein